uniref:PSII 6.1 kDa protein n=1 Tax=Aegilops tauschii TaxID=37682 RepID=R7VYK1_AEGTA
MAATAPMLGSALALADEQTMSIAGLNNDLLGWILLVAFGVVLSFYAVHSSTLDDDDQSDTGCEAFMDQEGGVYMKQA